MGFEQRKIDVTKQEVRYFNVRCDNCDAELEPVLPIFKNNPENGIDSLQFDNALVIQFAGGYGMYFDSVLYDPPPVILCKSCADELMERYPAFKDAIHYDRNQLWEEDE